MEQPPAGKSNSLSPFICYRNTKNGQTRSEKEHQVFITHEVNTSNLGQTANFKRKTVLL